MTLRLSSACSNQLSYTPAFALTRFGAASPNKYCRTAVKRSLLLAAKFQPAFQAVARFEQRLVELRRFELLTYSLQSYRSTN